jgi:hypothetical protein
MTDRHQYVQKLKTSLDEWDHDLDVFEARMRNAGDDLRQRSQQAVADLRSTRAQIAQDIDALLGTTDDAWQRLRLGLDKAWDNVKTGLLNARAELMPPTPPKSGQ